MPDERFLLLQMHEMLSYLNQQGVKTILVLGLHGIMGEVRADLDLSYLSDGILPVPDISKQGRRSGRRSPVVKGRASGHERSIREMKLGSDGIQVGEALVDFDGVLTGLRSYKGRLELLSSPPETQD